MIAGPAHAGTCAADPNYRWVGQRSPHNQWGGLERYIKRTSPTVSNPSLQHLIFWLGIEEYGTNGCPSTLGYCWLQAGHGIGRVGPAQTSSQKLYYEYNGTGAWGYFAAFPTFAAVGSNDFYNVFRDGINDSNGNPYFETWTNAGGSVQQMAYAALEAATGAAEVNAEAAQYTGSWPSIGGIASFGTDNSYNYSTNWSLFKSPDGASWVEWVNTPDAVCSQSPYTNANIHHWSAFKAY
jgi:hypothetical protein